MTARAGEIVQWNAISPSIMCNRIDIILSPFVLFIISLFKNQIGGCRVMDIGHLQQGAQCGYCSDPVNDDVICSLLSEKNSYDSPILRTGLFSEISIVFVIMGARCGVTFNVNLQISFYFYSQHCFGTPCYAPRCVWFIIYVFLIDLWAIFWSMCEVSVIIWCLRRWPYYYYVTSTLSIIINSDTNICKFVNCFLGGPGVIVHEVGWVTPPILILTCQCPT